jgi:hypothetical protein
MSLPLCCSFGNNAYLTVTITVSSKLHLEFLPPHMVINWCFSLASNALQCSLLLYGGLSETIQDCNPFGARLDVAWILFVLQHKISELCGQEMKQETPSRKNIYSLWIATTRLINHWNQCNRYWLKPNLSRNSVT